MRRRKLPVDERLVVARTLDPDEVVKREGAKVAAWLVQQHRRALRRDGYVLFDIDINARTPPWFLVGMKFLQRRPGWSVVTTEQSGKRRYRLEWLGRLREGVRKEIPLWRRN